MKTYGTVFWSVSVFDAKINDKPSIHDGSRTMAAYPDSAGAYFKLPTAEYNAFYLALVDADI